MLPTLWFRNTWSWGHGTPTATAAIDRGRRRRGSSADAPRARRLPARRRGRPGRRPAELLFCENETNVARLFGGAADHAVPEGRHQRPRRARRRATVNPDGDGHEGGGLVPARRSRPARSPRSGSGLAADRRTPPPATGRSMRRPRRSVRLDAAARVARPTSSTRARARRRDRRGGADHAPGVRRACSGASSSTRYDVARWLDGDPASRRPPSERHGAQRALAALRRRRHPRRCRTRGSTRGSPPGTSPSTRSRSPTSTRRSRSTSCSLLCREWFQHPNGALPAYEWSFDDVNPPVHALAALRVWEIDGAARHRLPQADLPQAADQLHLVAEPPGRRGQRPVRGRLPRARQPRARSTARTCRSAAGSSSPTRPAWMFAYCLLDAPHGVDRWPSSDPAYGDLVTTFLEHAVRIAGAMNQSGLWDDDGRRSTTTR